LQRFHTLKLLPAHIAGIEGEVVGIVAFGLAALALLLVPFLDRRASRGHTSPLFTALGIGALVYLVALTILGHLASG
jgi:quinol-cytochrome oxidoreductase complex cytochrome b subunit